MTLFAIFRKNWSDEKFPPKFMTSDFDQKVQGVPDEHLLCLLEDLWDRLSTTFRSNGVTGNETIFLIERSKFWKVTHEISTETFFLIVMRKSLGKKSFPRRSIQTWNAMWIIVSHHQGLSWRDSGQIYLTWKWQKRGKLGLIFLPFLSSVRAENMSAVFRIERSTTYFSDDQVAGLVPIRKNEEDKMSR